MRDVTERTLRDNLFRDVVDACPTGMVLADGRRRIVVVNRAAERLFGYSRGELRQESVDRLIPAAGHLLRAAIGANSTSVSPRHLAGQGQDLLAHRRDGSQFAAKVGLSTVRRQDEVLVLFSIEDLSERQRGNERKDEFVSTVSHELRTPMTSIAGSLALLVGGAAGPFPDSVLRLLTIAHKNSERLVRLINDILDIERIESGKVTFEFKGHDVLALVQDAIEANRGLAESVDVAVEVASEAVRCLGRVDADRFGQVMTNLLSNAVKFSPSGAAVSVAVTQESETIRISVRDRGPGIPAEFRSRIFEKFAQADTAGDRPKTGSGLGLSIVKQIILRFGGEVGFTDGESGGTVFFVTVPCWTQSRDAAREHRNGAQRRVLVCESDMHAAQKLCARLVEAGYQAEVAATAEAAMTRSARVQFGGFVIDPQLADLDGISLIQGIRKIARHRKTPLLLSAAEPAGRGAGRTFANLEILDWLEQPLDMGRLMQVLDDAVMWESNARPHILHVDDDPAVLGGVAQALDASTAVVSVDSAAGARRALQSYRFDLALIGIAVERGAGIELLADLCDSGGDAVPLIAFSARGMNSLCAARVQHALAGSSASVDQFISILSRGIARKPGGGRNKEVA